MGRNDLYLLLLQLIYDDLGAYVEKHIPQEAVAMLTSKGRIHPLINQRRSNHEFMVSTVLVAEAIEEISSRGDSAVAIFHSHPSRPAKPSGADKRMMEEAEGTVFAIWGTDRVACFVWEDSGVKEIAEVAHG